MVFTSTSNFLAETCPPLNTSDRRPNNLNISENEIICRNVIKFRSLFVLDCVYAVLRQTVDSEIVVVIWRPDLSSDYTISIRKMFSVFILH